jgi:hypothetical protein
MPDDVALAGIAVEFARCRICVPATFLRAGCKSPALGPAALVRDVRSGTIWRTATFREARAASVRHRHRP